MSVEWKPDRGFTRLVVNGITWGVFDGPGHDLFDTNVRGVKPRAFATEAEAAMHVVKHAWLAGHIVGAPTLSDGTVLRIDEAGITADILGREREINALRELLAVAVELSGGEA